MLTTFKYNSANHFLKIFFRVYFFFHSARVFFYSVFRVESFQRFKKRFFLFFSHQVLIKKYAVGHLQSTRLRVQFIYKYV